MSIRRHVAMGLLLLAVASPGLAQALDSSCGAAGEVRVEHDPAPRPAASDPFVAAQDGIDWLMGSLCGWMQTTGMQMDCSDGQVKTCMGCHVQAETVLGLARSSRRCYVLPATPCMLPGDESPLQFAARFIAESQRKSCILGAPTATCQAWGLPVIDPTTIDGQTANLGSIGHYPPCGSNSPGASIHPILQTAHGGLNLTGYTEYISPTYSTNVVALADWLVTQQDAGGRWIADRFEAPVDQGDIFCTGSAVMSMNGARPYATPAEIASYDAAIARASSWVQGLAPTTTQDKLFAMMTYLGAGLTAADIPVQILQDDIINDILPDGGWAERPGLGSNAYATGQALNALLDSGLPVDHPEVCSGIGWLVQNQNADGSWSMGVTGVTTDAGRPSEFTATIWPVLALGSLRPFGAAVILSVDTYITCADHVTWQVTIQHAADTACGLFARPDDYDLSVVNDSGDFVEVEPPLVSLQSGGSQVVDVTWRRNGPARPGGSVSLSTLSAISQGGIRANCPTEATAALRVRAAPDTDPGPMAGSLRVSRRDDDLELRWARHDQPVGGYEIVALPCASREVRPQDPEHAVLDARPPVVQVGPTTYRATLPGDAAAGGPGLVFYKVRAQSPCFKAPAPTCEFPCADARRCDSFCP
jgi:hypothetical protein